MLGRLGQLGNQMFQYAALFAIARRRGYGFCIPPAIAIDQYREQRLSQTFALPGAATIAFHAGAPVVRPRSFAFDPELAHGCPDHVDLFGYFQSERWFEDEAAGVRAEFAFRPEILGPCQAAIAPLGPQVIGLHVRRGDFVVKSESFPPCGADYYARALERMPAGLPVMVFSDDLDWCRAEPVFSGPRFTFSDGRSASHDLCLMSLCRHHVIANSSFSWWGAWLAGGEGQLVVAPQRWFGETGHTAALDTRDLVPERWARV